MELQREVDQLEDRLYRADQEERRRQVFGRQGLREAMSSCDCSHAAAMPYAVSAGGADVVDQGAGTAYPRVDTSADYKRWSEVILAKRAAKAGGAGCSPPYSPAKSKSSSSSASMTSSPTGAARNVIGSASRLSSVDQSLELRKDKIAARQEPILCRWRQHQRFYAATGNINRSENVVPEKRSYKRPRLQPTKATKDRTFNL